MYRSIYHTSGPLSLPPPPSTLLLLPEDLSVPEDGLPLLPLRLYVTLNNRSTFSSKRDNRSTKLTAEISFGITPCNKYTYAFYNKI